MVLVILTWGVLAFTGYQTAHHERMVYLECQRLELQVQRLQFLTQRSANVVRPREERNRTTIELQRLATLEKAHSDTTARIASVSGNFASDSSRPAA